MMMADVVFGVGTQVQFENIKPLLPILTDKQISFELMELATMKFKKIGIFNDARRPNFLALARALVFSFPKQTKILYLQQDVGLIEKILMSKAKKLSITTCINPDGLIWASRKVPKDPSLRAKAIEALNELLQAFRLIENKDNNWFKSEPDYIFSWGEAWESIYRSNSPTSVVFTTGCPRFEEYLSSNKREANGKILIASTPVELLGFSESELNVYYDMLLDLYAFIDRKTIRIRLHPHELISNRVPQALKNINSYNQLTEDLDWADIALSPISTVLLEAAIRNLSVGFIGEGSNLLSLRQENIFFSHLVDVLGKGIVSDEVERFKTKKLRSGIQDYCRMSPLPSHLISEKIYEICRGKP